MWCVDGVFFSWCFTFLRVFACHHLLHAVHFQPKFLHFKQTMCEILTCKIEPERKRREREKKTHPNNSIWKAAFASSGCHQINQLAGWTESYSLFHIFGHFRWASVPWFRHCFRCKLLWVALKTICSIWCWWRWLQCIQMTEAEIFDLRFSPNFQFLSSMSFTQPSIYTFGLLLAGISDLQPTLNDDDADMTAESPPWTAFGHGIATNPIFRKMRHLKRWKDSEGNCIKRINELLAFFMDVP